MEGTPGNDRPPTEVAGKWRSPGRGPSDDLDLRVGYGLANMPGTARKTSGLAFREFRITEVEDGWLAMVKGDKGRRPVVAFAYAETYRDALLLGLTLLDTGRCWWQDDDYPPKRYPDKPGRLIF